MSLIAGLNSKLNNYLSQKKELEEKLNEISLVKREYNEVKSDISALKASANIFENSSAAKINRPLAAGNSGNKVENIMNTISSTFGGNDFSIQASNLEADINNAYSELINKENEILNEIEILNADIASLEIQIAEEKNRLAEVARKESQKKAAKEGLNKREVM